MHAACADVRPEARLAAWLVLADRERLTNPSDCRERLLEHQARRRAEHTVAEAEPLKHPVAAGVLALVRLRAIRW